MWKTMIENLTDPVIEPRISSEPRADKVSPDFPGDPSTNGLATFATINTIIVSCRVTDTCLRSPYADSSA